jgi:hypothetical protein
MTSEERFERMEHVRAALVEERRKDREEYRQLWRETRGQIDSLGRKIADTNDAIVRLAEESREQDRLLGERMDQLAEEFRAADKILEQRIGAIGEFLSKK